MRTSLRTGSNSSAACLSTRRATLGVLNFTAIIYLNIDTRRKVINFYIMKGDLSWHHILDKHKCISSAPPQNIVLPFPTNITLQHLPAEYLRYNPHSHLLTTISSQPRYKSTHISLQPSRHKCRILCMLQIDLLTIVSSQLQKNSRTHLLTTISSQIPIHTHTTNLATNPHTHLALPTKILVTRL